MDSVDPRVLLPKIKGEERDSPRICAYRDAVQDLSRDVHRRLDELGIPSEIESGRLTTLGRFDLLLKTYEFEETST